MSRSLIQIPVIQQAKAAPLVSFASVQNKSSDYIEADAFLRAMRTELVKQSEGRIRFIDPDTHVSAALAPDYLLTGTIDSLDRSAGPGRTKYMRLSFRLTDAKTGEVVWEDKYELKKYESSGMYRH
jgi:PBP1b-binding outer membrane lipoprotein LpoB